MVIMTVLGTVVGCCDSCGASGSDACVTVTVGRTVTVMETVMAVVPAKEHSNHCLSNGQAKVSHYNPSYPILTHRNLSYMKVAAAVHCCILST